MNDYVFDTWGIGVGEYSHAEYRQNSKTKWYFLNVVILLMLNHGDVY